MGPMLGRDRLGKGTDTDCVDPFRLGRPFERHKKFIFWRSSMGFGDLIELCDLRHVVQHEPCRSTGDLDMRHDTSKEPKIQKFAKNPFFKITLWTSAGWRKSYGSISCKASRSPVEKWRSYGHLNIGQNAKNRVFAIVTFGAHKPEVENILRNFF